MPFACPIHPEKKWLQLVVLNYKVHILDYNHLVFIHSLLAKLYNHIGGRWRIYQRFILLCTFVIYVDAVQDPGIVISRIVL